ncbi:MAG: hypothetical protein K1X64_04385 [Myxococcaceae bacterium]|nr:hypothetical protein [Myxococcaceae bacterium]
MATGPVRTRLTDSEDSAAAQLLKQGDLGDWVSPAVVHRIGAKLASKTTSPLRRSLQTRWKWALIAVLASPFALAAVAKWAPLYWGPTVSAVNASPSRGLPLKPSSVVTPVVAPGVDSLPDNSAGKREATPVPQPLLQQTGVKKGGRARVIAEAPVEDTLAHETVPSPVVESLIAIETRLLASALEQLRKAKNPARALTMLDDYLARFPQGVFAQEASLARVDALLSLNRRREVLAALESLPPTTFTGVPHEEEMRLLHGQLLAEFGDCGAAMPIFDSALAEPRISEFKEGAMYWRAACLATQGDEATSRAELERYLTLFPAGRFVAQAKSALEGL